jgi:hypothetical protein
LNNNKFLVQQPYEDQGLPEYRGECSSSQYSGDVINKRIPQPNANHITPFYSYLLNSLEAS